MNPKPYKVSHKDQGQNIMNRCLILPPHTIPNKKLTSPTLSQAYRILLHAEQKRHKKKQHIQRKAWQTKRNAFLAIIDTKEEDNEQAVSALDSGR